jgi:hypothetical protein
MRWVVATIVLLVILQAGPSLYIVASRGIGASFNWAGYIGYQMGSLVIPLAVGCLGLLFRPNRGLGFFVAALAMFLLAVIGNLATTAAPL